MDKLIVVKHNAALAATYRMTANEQRLMLLCITKIIRKEATTSRKFRISHGEFCTTFNITEAYSNMLKAVKRLQKRSIEITEKVTIAGVTYDGGVINILSAHHWQEKNGEIMLSFSDEFMPYLEKLSLNFTSFNLKDVAGMKSVYAMRFYEIFKMHYEQQKMNKDAPHFVFEVEEMRAMFELAEKYPRHQNFKTRVIDVAVDEINKLSPLTVSYAQLKKGRRIHAYSFKIEPKSSQLEIKTTAQKNKRARAISELKIALEMNQKVSIKNKEIREIEGAIVSFQNGTSANIYQLMNKCDCAFQIEID